MGMAGLDAPAATTGDHRRFHFFITTTAARADWRERNDFPGPGWCEKFLTATFAAKIKRLPVALDTQRRGFVHRHSANGVFGHALSFFSEMFPQVASKATCCRHLAGRWNQTAGETPAARSSTVIPQMGSLAMRFLSCQKCFRKSPAKQRAAGILPADGTRLPARRRQHVGRVGHIHSTKEKSRGFWPRLSCKEFPD